MERKREDKREQRGGRAKRAPGQNGNQKLGDGKPESWRGLGLGRGQDKKI